MAGTRSSHGVLLAPFVGTDELRRSAEQRDELASPHGPPSVRGLHTTISSLRMPALCITAKLIVEWQGWVKSGGHDRDNAPTDVRIAPKADMTVGHPPSRGP